ncbi:serine hydrolase domain-containing protein [Georgenia deserti]|uniref:Serine hydrolase domain-containing protein n=1 Tax=Georgenia deserti TaxID=2093781 RepID=A0ABW4L686_9MICO
MSHPSGHLPWSGDLGRAVGALLARATAPRPAPAAGPQVAAPGAAALIAHRGEVLAHTHAGMAALYDHDGGLLPEADREPVTRETVWDIASLTKIVVALAALVQVDRGILDLDAPVLTWLPEFGHGPEGVASRGARARVTARRLLTHTAGLPAVARPWTVRGGRAERAAYLASQPLEFEPGTAHQYSCVGYQTLGLALERLTGRPLPELVEQSVAGPLGMTWTRYRPAAGSAVAATEYQPERGLVRGEVHDETAWALGGAGNAGLFSTAEDLLRLAEEVRTGRCGLVSETSRALLTTGTLPPAEIERIGYDQALGFRLGQADVMATDDRAVFGHTGFTGTSLVIDPDRELTVILLTNRVHPRRELFDVDPVRRELARLARDLAG